MRLTLKNVAYIYPDGTIALRGVDLEAKGGEITFLLGENGSGKTTLMLIVAGLLDPTGGRILLDDAPLGRDYRRSCGIMLQDPRDQLIGSSVWEDVSLAPKQLGLDDDTVEERTREALRFFGLEELSYKSPLRLSRGQAARVVLAGLLAHDPDILLLDEPWTSLDEDGVRRLLEMVRMFREKGRIVIISSQNSDMACEVADMVHLMKRGEIVVSGTAGEVLSRVDLMREAGIRPAIVPLISRVLLPSDPVELKLESLLNRLKRCFQSDEAGSG